MKAGGGTPPMQLKPSSQVLAVCGEAGVKELDKQMSKLKNRKGVNKRQGAFPLFYLDELQSKDVMPIFFTRDDLVTCWMSSGRAFEDMPSQLSVIDHGGAGGAPSSNFGRCPTRGCGGSDLRAPQSWSI